ncbi:MAG: Phage uncharacterized protein-like protein, partial [Edaphobacter sp.]|nr:Phage uncharacterized protein-like protein [Edaphobacter sp.]
TLLPSSAMAAVAAADPRYTPSKITPAISVVIAAYNDWNRIAGCLQSLSEQINAPKFEVIVVDDGSRTEAPDQIRKWISCFPMKFIRQPHAGLAVARNRGLQIATGTTFVFVDCDCVLRPDCFDSLMHAFVLSPEDGYFQLRLVGDCSNMQRLHEDDLVGHVQELEEWKVLRFPAIAEEDEEYVVPTFFGYYRVQRLAGEALHPDREPIETLENLRRTQGEYNFAGQYQQSPAPLGGGLIKANWFQFFQWGEEPREFDLILQSWDTANKSNELSDYSVGTTWGKKDTELYLLDVFRFRLDYPDLKRAVYDYARQYEPRNVLIEDKASGTQLIQELRRDGMYGVTRYEPKMDKIMRLHSVTSTIENGFVYLPVEADWLADYLHELTTFPNGKYDDQSDSTSQALDWIRNRYPCYGLAKYYEQEMQRQYFGTVIEDASVMTCTIPETGQTFRMEGARWIDIATGIPYVGP